MRRSSFDTSKYAMKWDGEWHITIEVFRDLGLAFATVLLLIYVLVVGWFESFNTPLLTMAAIPFFAAIRPHLDVGRLEVAVDDPLLVCGFEASATIRLAYSAFADLGRDVVDAKARAWDTDHGAMPPRIPRQIASFRE